MTLTLKTVRPGEEIQPTSIAEGVFVVRGCLGQHLSMRWGSGCPTLLAGVAKHITPPRRS